MLHDYSAVKPSVLPILESCMSLSSNGAKFKIMIEIIFWLALFF